MHIDDININDKVITNDGRVGIVRGFQIFESGKELVCVRFTWSGAEEYVSAKALELSDRDK